MPPWPSGIAAVVPVYNHANAVGSVVEALRSHGAAVIAVDDGSTDGSGGIAAQAGATVVRLPGNAGKGAAILAGLSAAGAARQVVTVDADGQHAAGDALRLALAAASEPDALHIGVRNLAAAPWSSRCGRRMSNAAVRLCCRTAPGDSQSGLRAYPLPTTLGLGARARRFAWEVEILVLAARAGIALRHHPVACAYPSDRVSHFAAVRDTLRATGVLLRLACSAGPARRGPPPEGGPGVSP